LESGLSKKRQIGKVIDLQKPPVYVMGKIESNFGKKYFFHKSNEKEEIFLQLKIGSKVTFETTQTEKGPLAINIEVVKD